MEKRHPLINDGFRRDFNRILDDVRNYLASKQGKRELILSAVAGGLILGGILSHDYILRKEQTPIPEYRQLAPEQRAIDPLLPEEEQKELRKDKTLPENRKPVEWDYIV